jgi:hypothetical protein
VKRLYVETNFVIDCAKGETDESRSILALAERGEVELRIPVVSVMESYKAWEAERRRVVPIMEDLRQRLPKLQGWRGERVLSEAIASLRDGLVEMEEELHEVRSSISSCIRRITIAGAIVPLPRSWCVREAGTSLIEAEPDDMILATVLADAEGTAECGFLTKNISDFKAVTVRDAARARGVRMLYHAGHAESWICGASWLMEDE